MEFRKLFEDGKIKGLARDSWAVSWPMTLIMLCVFLMGLTDVYVAGKLGREVQASYGVAIQFYIIFSIVASALSIGSVSVTAFLFTSGKKKELKAAINSALFTAFAAGLLFSIIGFTSAKNIVTALNVPRELRDYVVPLTKIFSLGLLFSYLFLNTSAILRACGMIKKALGITIFVCALNIILNFELGLNSPLGFKGIAAATTAASFSGFILSMFFIRKLAAGFFSFSVGLIKKIISIGWPAGLLQIIWQFGYMALYWVLGSLPEHNIEILAAFTNGLKIEAAIFLPAFAFNMANSVIVGNLLGKGRKEDAYSAGLVTAFTGVSIVIVLTVFTLLNSKIIALFLSNNNIVVSETVRYIYISMISEPFMAWGVILAGGLNGAGDTKSVMLIVSLSMWLVRIPLCYALGLYFGLGATAVWWSMNASILAQMVFISRRYFSKKWIDKVKIVDVV